jgi:1-Cys peroxiredoxin 6
LDEASVKETLAGDMLVVEGTWTGTQEATKAKVTVPFIATITTKDGKITRVSQVQNLATAPAPAGQNLATAPAPAGRAGGINLGDEMPNFEAETTSGTIKFHDFIGDSWVMLFSHPADFTPVCTTELSTAAKLVPEFGKRNVKLIAVSCDPVDMHNAWIGDVVAYDTTGPSTFPFPIIADPKRDLAVRLGMLDAVSKDNAGLPNTARAVFLVGPDKKMKLSILYPATTGRNFDELIRVVDSVQLTATRRLATPANWVTGQDCVVASSVSQEEAPGLFPKGVRIVTLPSKKPYLRFTPDPR